MQYTSILIGLNCAVGLALGQPGNDPTADSRACVVSGNARFTVLTPALIRMEYAPDAKFEDRATYAIINRRLPVPRYSIMRSGGWLDLQTSEIRLRYKSGSGPFAPGNLSVMVKHTGRAVNSAPVTWTPGTTDTGNLLGTVRTLDSVNGARPLEPGILSRDGWAIVDDTTRTLLTTDVHTTGAPLGDWPWAAERPSDSHRQDLYFFGHGRDYKRALQEFISVAGKIPMPPKWSFGAWWSRYWAYSDTELKELVADFRAHGVPLDVLVIDMDWHLQGWTGYSWNPKYFPDPEGFLKWAHDEGLHVTLNLHPADGVAPHETAYPEVAKAMGIDPNTSATIPFDITNSRFVDAYFRLLHHPLEKQGIDFWWLDWQQGTNTKLTNIDPLHWLNYLHWTDMERNPAGAGQRPLLFSRWGGLGNHRYQTGFSGDTYNDWPSLAFQPYFTATAGNVGYAYWSHDIGGHIPGPVAPDLYTRWMQWAAFNPILRTHGGNTPTTERRIWAFPGENYEMLKHAWYLRYSLIPYIYTAARQCYDTGMPLLRPLYYHWPELDEAYTHGNQYMFGNDLLVNPVVEPADPASSCTLQKTWLPPGEWIDWYTDEVTTGPAEIEQLISMDRIPVWARSGAIIPTATVKRLEGAAGKRGASHWAKPQTELGYRSINVLEPVTVRGTTMPAFQTRAIGSTAGQPDAYILLDVFPGDSGEAILYQDDGETTGYQLGEIASSTLRKFSDTRFTTVTVEPMTGSYTQMPTRRTFELRLRSAGDMTGIYQILVNGSPLETTGVLSNTVGPGPALGYGDYILWNLPAFTSTDRVDFVFEHLDGGKAAELAATGARNLLQIMSEICYAQNRSGGKCGAPGAAGTQILQNCVSGCTTTSTIDRLFDQALRSAADLPDGFPDRLKFILQLLGITVRIEVRADANGEAEVSMVLRRIDAAQDLSITGQLQVNGGIGATFEDEPLYLKAGEKEGRVTWKIAAPDATMPTQLRASISLSIAGRDIRIPLSALLPAAITNWHVVGPFDNPAGIALDKVFPPEEQPFTPAAKYAGKGAVVGWRHVVRTVTPGEDLTREFVVDLHKVFGGHTEKAAAYAYTIIQSDRDTKATLFIGADDGVAAWLNGRPVWRNAKGRPYRSGDDKIEVQLKKGDNPLLLKISQGTNDWAFSVHVEVPQTADSWIENQMKQPKRTPGVMPQPGVSVQSGPG
ncbi:MAG: TIM-barrel domain-containing protein [Candidatus Sumerlaeaceae bacterium]